MLIVLLVVVISGRRPEGPGTSGSASVATCGSPASWPALPTAAAVTGARAVATRPTAGTAWRGEAAIWGASWKLEEM